MANPDSLSSPHRNGVIADFLSRLSRPNRLDSLTLAVIYVSTAKIGQLV